MSQSQRNVLFGAIAIVALLGALYFFTAGSKRQVEIGRSLTTYGRCLACEYEGFVTFPLGQIAPFDCKECGETAVYGLYYCSECKKRFVPMLQREGVDGPLRPPQPPLVVICPACHGSQVTGYVPELFADECKGHLAWPEWP